METQDRDGRVVFNEEWLAMSVSERARRQAIGEVYLQWWQDKIQRMREVEVECVLSIVRGFLKWHRSTRRPPPPYSAWDAAMDAERIVHGMGH
jgi:hypothetical protein